MAIKLDFDDLSAEVEKEYPDLELAFRGDTLVFGHPLRQSQEWRDGMKEHYARLGFDSGDDDVDEAEVLERTEGFRNLLRYVCIGGNFDALADVVKDDGAMWLELFVGYSKAVTPGEASPSEAS